MTLYAASPVTLPDSCFRVLRSNPEELLIEFSAVDLSVDTLHSDNGQRCVRVTSPWGVFSSEQRRVGHPMSLLLSCALALPSITVAPTIEIVRLDEQWNDLPLVPFPEGGLSNDTCSLRWRMDQEWYRAHAQPVVQFVRAGIARGIPIGHIVISVADYDGQKKKTRIVERCTLRICFPHSLAESPRSVDILPSFLNLSQLQHWTRKGTRLQRRSSPFVFDASTRWLKVTVSEEGVYAVTADQLAQIGVTIPPELVPSIKLYGYGGQALPELPSQGAQNTPIEQPLLVETNPDGSLRSIVFYAAGPRGFRFNSQLQRWERYLNPYTSEVSYLLGWGGSPGLRAIPQAPPQQEPTHFPRYFFQRILLETDRVNAYTQPSGRRWLGDPFDQSSGITLTPVLPGLAMNGPYAEYTVCVAHKDELGGTVVVSEHGRTVRTLTLPGKNSRIYSEYVSIRDTVRVPIDLIASDQRAVIRLTYQSSQPLAAAYLDYIELAYPALLVAQNNALHIYTEPVDTGIVEYAINGFSSTPLCYDITDPVRPTLCMNLSMVASSAVIRTVLDSASQRVAPRQLYVSSERKRPQLSVAAIGEARDTTLSADVVVITPLEFLESANRYAHFRRSHSSMEVVVMPLEHVYSAFAAGIPDPSAIRDFVSFAYYNWRKRPRYVLIWGDGHCDYRNITTSVPNWVPPYENEDVDIQIGTPRVWSYADDSYSTEDYYGRVDGDDYIPDIAIGRLPITSDDVGDMVAQKLQAYETASQYGPWQMTMTFVADDGPTSGGKTDRALHVNSSERVSQVVTASMPAVIQRKIYMPEFPAVQGAGGNRKPAVTDALLSIVNGQGTLILNWLGHGNPRVWAHEEVFDRDKTTALLNNGSKNFFLVAATCDFARFDLPDVQSGGEELVLWKQGGAIGVFSALRVVYTFGNEAISLRFYQELSRYTADGKRRRLGDVVLAVKQVSFDPNDWRYFLLGDPAQTLLLPEASVAIDTIDEVPITSDTVVTHCALSRVRIQGSVRHPLTRNVLDSYSGTATLILFDADLSVRTQDPAALALGDSTFFQFWKTGGMLHRGNYPIYNGTFVAEFIVPKDGSLSDSSCRIHVYGVSSGTTSTAMGISRALRVNCISLTSVEDRQGPTINLYVDSRRFQPGDWVRNNPLLIVDLWDESGINATGIGVGHKIEAWLDDNLTGIDLTEYYDASATDWRAGTVQRQLTGLTPGLHTLQVRAWDVWNNFNVATTWFYVGESDTAIKVGRLIVFPHPFDDMVTVEYNHNQNIPLSSSIRITTLSGEQVWYQTVVVNNLNTTSFVWNGRDNEGRTLPAGVYVYTIVLTNSSGSEHSIRGLLVKNH